MLKGKDMLSIHDLSVDEVQEILALAAELKAKQKAGVEHHLLKGKTLGMIFEKSSTRTRVSFETGMYQLGGQAAVPVQPGSAARARGADQGYGPGAVPLSRWHHDPDLRP
jgi:ornithine carbamoyltransferase